MKPPPDGVAKVFIKVERDGVAHYLFSFKNVYGRSDHAHLELLGGHIDGDTPIKGAIRELGEEEVTGLLASRITEQHLMTSLDVEGCHHFLYEFTISLQDYASLKPCAKESLGFELVPIHKLFEEHMMERFTIKTLMILLALMEVRQKTV